MKTKLTLMFLSALAAPVLFSSCSNCTAFNVDVVDIPHYAPKGTVTAVVPVQVPLTSEEAEQIRQTSNNVWGFIKELGDDGKPKTEKELRAERNTDKLIDGVGSVLGAAVTKAGQQITVKNSKGGTTLITQPVYCHFGEIQLGETGRIVKFNGRRVFFPNR